MENVSFGLLILIFSPLPRVLPAPLPPLPPLLSVGWKSEELDLHYLFEIVVVISHSCVSPAVTLHPPPPPSIPPSLPGSAGVRAGEEICSSPAAQLKPVSSHRVPSLSVCRALVTLSELHVPVQDSL